jgi:hypothetical protein
VQRESPSLFMIYEQKVPTIPIVFCHFSFRWCFVRCKFIICILKCCTNCNHISILQLLILALEDSNFLDKIENLSYFNLNIKLYHRCSFIEK